MRLWEGEKKPEKKPCPNQTKSVEEYFCIKDQSYTIKQRPFKSISLFSNVFTF